MHITKSHGNKIQNKFPYILIFTSSRLKSAKVVTEIEKQFISSIKLWSVLQFYFEYAERPLSKFCLLFVLQSNRSIQHRTWTIRK